MIITIILSAISLSFWFYSANRTYARYKAKYHSLRMQEERNKQVYAFRIRMINQFAANINGCMPSYDDMLKSNKPLTAANWVDVDRLLGNDREMGCVLDLVPYVPVHVEVECFNLN